MRKGAARLGRAYRGRYPGLAGVILPLLTFEVLSYNLRYLTGSLDGVPVGLAVIMHAHRILILGVLGSATG